MSIALNALVHEIKDRVLRLEQAAEHQKQNPDDSLSAKVDRLEGEIKAMKMRMGKQKE